MLCRNSDASPVAHSPQKEPRRMSGAKFGRSIMGLAGEVANPSLKHRPASDGFYVESPTQHRLHSAHKKRPRRRAGLRGSSSCADRLPDRLHSAGKTCSQGKQSVKARCGWVALGAFPAFAYDEATEPVTSRRGVAGCLRRGIATPRRGQQARCMVEQRAATEKAERRAVK